MEVHVVYNVAAGEGITTDLLQHYVRPRLQGWVHENASSPVLGFHPTDREEGALQVGVRLRHHRVPFLAIVVMGGDGTVHELIEGLLLERRLAHRSGEEAPLLATAICIAIVPTGTANAMYHSLFPQVAKEPGHNEAWRMHSLDALVKSHGDQKLLQKLTVLEVYRNSVESMKRQPSNLGLVVSSHAMHAAILRDSEKLRAEHPGTERFQIAAKSAMQQWSKATLTLHACEGGHVQRYDPASRSFRNVEDFDEYEVEGSTLKLEGPFAYMNAMLVDRLEEKFIVAPFASEHSRLPRPAEAMDIIVIRPDRSARTRDAGDGESARQAFAADVLTPLVFDGMYDGGKHVDFTYAADGSLQRSGTGPPVVEYFRVSGYDWFADHEDADARTGCVDGTLYTNSYVFVRIDTKCDVSVWCKSA